MPPSPDIRILKVEHGSFSDAPSLNPRFSPSRPLLLVTLDIRWHADEPREAVAHVERTLLAFSPQFVLHQCRGHGPYQDFSGSRAEGPPEGDPEDGYDPRLAPAHLLEHAVIDFQCQVAPETRCSGVTAAHRSAGGRFDVMAE